MAGKVSRAVKLHEAADFIVENFYDAVLRPNVALEKEAVIKQIEEKGYISVIPRMDIFTLTEEVRLTLRFDDPTWVRLNVKENISMAGVIMRQVAREYYRKGQDAARADMRKRLGLEL